MNDFRIDPARTDRPETGIYVRAKVDGKWGPVDINHLDTESLIAFLVSRGTLDWPVGVVLHLLGHPRDFGPAAVRLGDDG